MADLMLFPPAWYTGPAYLPEPPEDVVEVGGVLESPPEHEVLCKHHEGPDCFDCYRERRPY